MGDAMVRVTGEVTLMDVRSGISKTGKPYQIHEATVLVQRLGTVTCTLTDRVADVREGDSVDWLVTVDVFGGRPQFRAQRPFDSKRIAAAAPAAPLVGAASKP